MRTLFVTVLFCSLFQLFICQTYNANWRLAWSDEFNGNTLDNTKWTALDQPGNWGNGEKQYYRPSQAIVANGLLTLNATNVPYNGLNYISAWVDSEDKAFFTYARYSFRAIMAGTNGLWPAIWLLSNYNCWPWGSEIDIMEFRGRYPSNVGAYLHYASKCCATWNNCVASSGQEKTVSGVNFAKTWHNFTVDVWPNNVTWWIDGSVIQSVTSSQLASGYSFDKSPHFIVFNNAVGGSYPGDPDSSTVFPALLSIDYARVYIYRPSCSGETCSGHGCCSSSTVLCVCDAGWAGTNCEFWVGSYTYAFASQNSKDMIQNGWGNNYTEFLTANTAISRGLILTLSTVGCPSGCEQHSYSSGGWESQSYYSYGTFSLLGKGSGVTGTGFSVGAGGQSLQLEQIAFLFVGQNKTQVQLATWHNNWNYVHTTLNLGFDHTTAYHNYTFVYAPTTITWYIDGAQVFFSDNINQPNGTLRLNAFYQAKPEWYGPFTYSAPSSARVQSASWIVTPQSAVCS